MSDVNIYYAAVESKMVSFVLVPEYYDQDVYQEIAEWCGGFIAEPEDADDRHGIGIYDGYDSYLKGGSVGYYCKAMSGEYIVRFTRNGRDLFIVLSKSDLGVLIDF